MRYEIRERCNAILEADSVLGSVIQTTDEIPDTVFMFPLAIWLPRQDSGYTRKGSSNYRTTVTWEYYVLLAPLGQRLKSINEIEALTFPDLFASAFLTRPYLQLNDNGLSKVAGELTFQIVSDLLRPLQYPIGFADAPRYFGFIARMSIPYEDTYEIIT